MEQGTLPENALRRRKLVLDNWVCNKRNVVVVVRTSLLYLGVELRHVMEIQEILVIGESIKLSSLVLIWIFMSCYSMKKDFWPFSRIWEIWSMEDWSILRVVVPYEEISPLERIMIFHGVDFGLNKYEFYLDMLDTPKSMKGGRIIGCKGGMMLVIWSNCNSMMSLSNHILVWYQ